MIDIKNLKSAIEERTGGETDQTKRFLGYVDSINKKVKKKDGTYQDLTFDNSSEDFLKLFIRYNNVGITIDGVNAVLAGYNKVFITWVGYKNKVLSVYPESEFDTQLVREKDTFTLGKESGSVVYSHTIADPFSSNVGIKGAYCIIKNKRGEFVETLGQDDFEKMKESAMMKSTWDKWESEFWLKSVIKRACKRHFNDVVEEIEKIDNEDYALEDGYVKLTPLERTLSRYTSWFKFKLPEIGYETEEQQKNFYQTIIKKDEPETEAECIEVEEAIKLELPEDEV